MWHPLLGIRVEPAYVNLGSLPQFLRIKLVSQVGPASQQLSTIYKATLSFGEQIC